MPKDFFTDQIKQRFSGQTYITRGELFDFYRYFEPNLKAATFGWRIYVLKEQNILKPVKRGVYTLSVKPSFHPAIEPKLKELSKKINKQFPAARYCTWNTRWLNEWMIHQAGKFLLMVELEATAVESAFYFLKDQGYRNVFFNPDENLLQRYIYEETETIIVKTLVTKAPIKKENKIFTPVLEKILVDLFIDKVLFAPFQGSELMHIYNFTYRQYSVNITKLLAYATRRAKERELLDFITKQTQLVELVKK